MPSSTEKQSPDAKGPNWKPWAAGLGVAAGSFALMRRGKKGVGKLNRIANTPHKEQSWVGQQVDRILYGADNVLYHDNTTKGKMKKVPGTILHDLKSHTEFKGDKNLTTEGGNPLATRLRKSKIYEDQFIRKYAPEFATPGKPVSKMGDREDLLKILKKKKENFFIKPDHARASGVGGEKFIRPKDIKKYPYNKGRLGRDKAETIEDMLEFPEEYLYQKDLKIQKGFLTGANSEVRVHAIGNKVVPGATNIRGKNLEDIARQQQAEEYFQKFLNKVPAKVHRDGMAWAPDIAFTNNGPRIIELNAGALDSGLLDPRYMVKTHGTGTKGTATAFSAMRNNLAIYKQVTGREHSATATLKALGYGSAGAGGAALAQKYQAKKQEKN